MFWWLPHVSLGSGLLSLLLAVLYMALGDDANPKSRGPADRDIDNRDECVDAPRGDERIVSDVALRAPADEMDAFLSADGLVLQDAAKPVESRKKETAPARTFEAPAWRNDRKVVESEAEMKVIYLSYYHA